MTQAHTDKITVVTNALVTKFKNDALLGPTSLLKALTPNLDGNVPAVQPGDIWYGDQDKLPRVPAICVEPGNKNRDLKGAARTGQTLNTFLVYVLVYNAGPEEQITRRQVDEIAEGAEALMHADLQLKNGGIGPAAELVVQGYVTFFESGYTYRNNTLYRSVRMTWEAISKTRLS